MRHGTRCQSPFWALWFIASVNYNTLGGETAKLYLLELDRTVILSNSRDPIIPSPGNCL